MHKTCGPIPKFPNCVCDLGVHLRGWEVPASPCPHAAVPWGGFRGDQGWGWQERRGRRRFLCCAFVSGGSGIAFLRVRSSELWVFPGGSRVESLSGCRAVSSAVSLGQVETSQSLRKGWEGTSCIRIWGFLCIPLGCLPKILSGGQPCTWSLWSVSGWGAGVQGMWDSWGVVTIEQTRVPVKNSHGNVHFALP